MGDPRTKAERSKAKDARQMPVADPGKHPSKRKRDKPFIVECRRNPNDKIAILRLWGANDWRPWGRYHSMEIAQTALDLAARKYSFYEFRIGGDDGRG